MTVGIVTATCLQHRSFPPCLQISSPSSLSSKSQNASRRAQCTVLPGWVLSRSHQCVTHRFPVESRSPAVGKAPAASRVGVAEEDEDDEEEEDALALYEEELGQEDEEELGHENEELTSAEDQNANPNGTKVRRTFRLLGNKEMKELRAYSHQLGNDICIHQVGKWGLTANCVTAISDALEANELVKIRVLDNLDEEFDDTASQLEGQTGAQIVGKMGRTLLLYRPSMRKLKAAQAAEQKAYQYQKRKNMLASRAKSSRSFPGASKGKR